MARSTKSKHSTESDTVIKNPKAGSRDHDPGYIEAEQRIKQRWSKSADRISGLTIKILFVNVIAIMILGVGILYLGRYTNSLINSELEALKTEAQLFSGAISEGAVRPVFEVSPIPFQDPRKMETINPKLAQRMVRRLGEIGNSRIQLFEISGKMLSDSHQLSGPGGVVQMEKLDEPNRLDIETLFFRSSERFIDLIPTQNKLPAFPADKIDSIFGFPDTNEALQGNISATAWERPDGSMILTAAAPVQNIKQILGVTFLIRDGAELEKAISEVRVDVFRVFLGALGLTVMLSTYLSGAISKPLQKLATAAEAVRMGHHNAIEEVDLNKRKDEIGELSIAFRDMTRALQERMDTIERFAADVSHEIKNPLTSLRSAVETAAKVKNPEDQQKLMDIIQNDVKRLDRLISDISNASRLDSELSRDVMEAVDLQTLLTELQGLYQKPMSRASKDGNIVEETQIQLSFPEGSEIYVLGNKTRLSQVFGNLISNAISFSPKNALVRIQVYVQEKDVEIRVEDSGPGIPEGKLEGIFERFYTERPAHEDYGNHSGLGLSIARQIIEAHNGEIYAENIKEDGKVGHKVMGARFVVRLEKV